jgi:FtsP/CotA-like multicopper oxidase with cupredoxin domain
MKLKPIALATTVIVASLAWSVPTGAEAPPLLEAPGAEACDDPTNAISLFAENLGNGKIGYGRTPGTARIPGPTLQMTEGDCLEVNLVNDTNERLSMHAHGVDYTIKSDGTPINRGCVAPGTSRTYVFQAHLPTTRTDGTIDPGSAGYWHYHDHCRGTPHGTAGVGAGLFGALVVRRAGDPVPDRNPFVVVMSGTQINLKRAPRTPIFKANMGERIEFIVIGHGDLFHTFHLHGHRWADNRTGMTSSLTDDTQLIDNRVLGPADSFGFQVIAGEHVGPGAWMYHCHVQGHSDSGMSGLLLVRTEDGKTTKAGAAAVRRWKKQESGGHH